jgi:hypothetical protein
MVFYTVLLILLYFYNTVSNKQHYSILLYGNNTVSNKQHCPGGVVLKQHYPSTVVLVQHCPILVSKIQHCLYYTTLLFLHNTVV